MVNRLVVGWFLLVLFTGCSESHAVRAPLRDAGDDSPDSSDPGRPAAAPSVDLCTRFAAVQCEGELLCCGRSSRSRESCQAELIQACAQSLYLDAIAQRPESGFDDGVAERAFTELARRTARCDPSVLRWVSSSEGLRGMFRGTRGAGESCNPPGGVTGDPAGVATSLTVCRIGDGLACLPNGLLGNWSCAPKQPAGQACLTDDNCQPAEVCDNFSEPMLGRCATRLELEAVCDAAEQCDSLACDDGVCTALEPEQVFCPAAE